MLIFKKTNPVPSFDDIVFEHRNRNYGAYLLRRDYDRNVIKAFLITVGAVLLITGHSLIGDLIFGPDTIPVSIPDIDIIFNKPPEVPGSIPDQPKTRTETGPAANDKPNQETIPLVVAKDSLSSETLKTDTSSVASTPGPVTGGKPGPSVPGNDTIGNSAAAAEIPGPKFTDYPDIMPEFPGGEAELFRYLGKSVKYPRIPLNEGVQSTVYVAFVVNKDGNITDINIIRTGGFAFDEEVVRVVKKMPRWKPGKMNGQDVSVRFRMPVKFKLQPN